MIQSTPTTGYTHFWRDFQVNTVNYNTVRKTLVSSAVACFADQSFGKLNPVIALLFSLIASVNDNVR
jgi:hypothetical protein